MEDTRIGGERKSGDTSTDSDKIIKLLSYEIRSELGIRDKILIMAMEWGCNQNGREAD